MASTPFHHVMLALTLASLAAGAFFGDTGTPLFYSPGSAVCGKGSWSAIIVGDAAKVYDGRVGVTLIKAALRRNGFSSMAKAIDDSGLNETLAKLLPKNQVTILAPNDVAFRPSVVGVPLKVKSRLLQTLAYHVFAGRLTYAQLLALKPFTLFKTADYGLTIQKLNYKKSVIFGKPGASNGGAIMKANLYEDPQVIVHGLSKVIFPPYFT